MLGLVADRLSVKSPPKKSKNADIKIKNRYSLVQRATLGITYISNQDYNFWMNLTTAAACHHFVLLLMHVQINWWDC